MLKKTIAYKDVEGGDVVEDFYFNINKAELAEMELSEKGGLAKYLEQIIATEDGAQIMSLFKRIVLAAVGKRSEDGKRFYKSEEIRQDFLCSDAYSVLFMELVTNAEKGAEFIRAIVPTDLLDGLPAIEGVAEDVPAWIREDREPTNAELRTMTNEQMREAFAKHYAKDPTPGPTLPG